MTKLWNNFASERGSLRTDKMDEYECFHGQTHLKVVWLKNICNLAQKYKMLQQNKYFIPMI